MPILYLVKPHEMIKVYQQQPEERTVLAFGSAAQRQAVVDDINMEI